MREVFLVSLGSFFGGGLRFLISKVTGLLVATPFPAGTFVVNILGCLLIGFFLLKPSNNKPQNDANVTSEVTESVSNETKDGAEQIEDAPSTSVGQTTLQADSEELYAAANERVKYGAYKIVGIDTIITVTPGMTLQRIATIFLGSQMMMYLSAINDGNDNPQPGEQYKIPKIKLK